MPYKYFADICDDCKKSIIGRHVYFVYPVSLRLCGDCADKKHKNLDRKEKLKKLKDV